MAQTTMSRSTTLYVASPCDRSSASTRHPEVPTSSTRVTLSQHPNRRPTLSRGAPSPFLMTRFHRDQYRRTLCWDTQRTMVMGIGTTALLVHKAMQLSQRMLRRWCLLTRVASTGLRQWRPATRSTSLWTTRRTWAMLRGPRTVSISHWREAFSISRSSRSECWSRVRHYWSRARRNTRRWWRKLTPHTAQANPVMVQQTAPMNPASCRYTLQSHPQNHRLSGSRPAHIA